MAGGVLASLWFGFGFRLKSDSSFAARSSRHLSMEQLTLDAVSLDIKVEDQRSEPHLARWKELRHNRTSKASLWVDIDGTCKTGLVQRRRGISESEVFPWVC